MRSQLFSFKRFSRYALSVKKVYNVSDIPQKILLKIILYLNARERIALGNSSKIFYSLVFKEEESLRDLDFSEGRLTSLSDIEKYFSKENTRKYILKVNLKNVSCSIQPEILLMDYIAKATNLVDINIQGTELEDVKQLGRFLEYLSKVKRLSIDWPKRVATKDITILEKSFTALTFLSVRFHSALCLKNLFNSLEYCQQLKELRIVKENCCVEASNAFQDTRAKKLTKNLEILEFCGNSAHHFEEYFFNMLPDKEKWTKFTLSDPLNEMGFYYEKNIEVCDELRNGQQGQRYSPIKNRQSKRSLIWFNLLKAVITKKYPNLARSRICCLLHGTCLLKIEDAKALLKNPNHPITYLYLTHSIDKECDADLLGLAFPTLKELHLSNLTRSEISSRRVPHDLRSFGYTSIHPARFRGWMDEDLEEDCFEPTDSPIPTDEEFIDLMKEYVNQQKNCFRRSYDDLATQGIYQGDLRCEPSFARFVENTPGVTNLTLDGRSGELGKDEAWDLEALDVIGGWKGLKSLRLFSIPIVNGEFLIEIGRNCRRLEKLELHDLGYRNTCCYTKDLSLMLPHCENLTDFSMKANNVGDISRVLVSLAKNPRLKRVRFILKALNEIETADLVPSVERLFRRCSQLITFVCVIDGIPQTRSDELISLLRRLRVELNRPSLQFQVIRQSDSNLAEKIDTVTEDSVPSSFPYNFKAFRY